MMILFAVGVFDEVELFDAEKLDFFSEELDFSAADFSDFSMEDIFELNDSSIDLTLSCSFEVSSLRFLSSSAVFSSPSASALRMLSS